MKIFRILLSIMVAAYMTQVGYLALAQDADTTPFSITLEPVQYASVKGNVGKFEALNWMQANTDNNGGISNISFVKDINKNISLEVQGSAFPGTDTGTGHLVLQDGDVGFLRVDYNAFRKWYDGTGGFYPNQVVTNTAGNPPPASYTNYGSISSQYQGYQANSPALQMDISYFKLEAGLGPISDPYLDIAYEHNTKNGDKSLLEWTPVYAAGQTASGAERKIGPAWESLNSYVDTITLKEKKKIAGVTIKADQKAEFDYNNDVQYMQYLNDTTSTPNQLNTYNESPNAKLFGAGVRAEKWMLNDNTYAAVGYHYNHIHDTDLMQQAEFSSTDGVVYTPVTSGTSGWNYSSASEDDHVLVGNLNSNLTKNVDFLTDVKYEHKGSEGDSAYYAAGTTGEDDASMKNREDQTGEHVGLRFYGIPHTSVYMDGEWQQDRNWVDESYTALPGGSTSNTFSNLERLNRTQKESWTVGARTYPNRFIIFSTQARVHDQYSGYDTISNPSASGLVLMSSLREKGVDETSTLTWKPFHWLQNSLKYQFSDTVYNPQLDPSAGGSSDPLPADGNYNISENHMLTSAFTYDITLQPIDTLLLMLSYSHVENYVRTIAASSAGTSAEGGPSYIPDFNSGDNSFLFSTTYSPTENWVWTNTASYTISNNYVDSGIGVPYGSDFKMFNYTTSLDWTWHKWLKIGPQYEYAAYKDNPTVGSGNYSANIFLMKLGFNW
ncbi:MAG: hypothetical protein KGJ09_01140 [Candidatus Omnitrophica bacterium]|nr:hypothetical protein [Candidatus Omnitrophota bacterium]MDE2008664.1 hypothetical protein [Candidatus Omnitrophota bacterium]MDE2214953.1 hypothetical protein [Candidatus Omnitrophota bacterium]MDE2230892.1 hypothetical protein [Candidatus Omnitrophota bacterium]